MTYVYLELKMRLLRWFGDNYKRVEVLDPAQTLHVGTAARQTCN